MAYADVPADVRALAAELESLGGGGDAALGVAAVYCSVCPAPVRAASLAASPHHRSRARADAPRAVVVARAEDDEEDASADGSDEENPDNPSAPNPSPSAPPSPTGNTAGARDKKARRIRGGGASLVVSDPHAPPDGTIRAARPPRRYRRFRSVSGVGGAPEGFANDVVDWLWRGFDALVVAHGQSGTGKTRILHGAGGGAFERDAPGCVSRIIRAMFARAQSAEREAQDAADDAARREMSAASSASSSEPRVSAAPPALRHLFGLSCWEMTPDGALLDLFDPRGAGGGFTVTGSGSAGGFGDRFGSDLGARCTTVSVRSAADAEAALAHARRQSANWTTPTRRADGAAPGAYAGTVSKPRANRAHAFVRLTTIREPDGVATELHVVDLIGSRSLSLAEPAEEPPRRSQLSRTLGARAGGRRAAKGPSASRRAARRFRAGRRRARAPRRRFVGRGRTDRGTQDGRERARAEGARGGRGGR